MVRRDIKLCFSEVSKAASVGFEGALDLRRSVELDPITSLDGNPRDVQRPPKKWQASFKPYTLCQ